VKGAPEMNHESRRIAYMRAVSSLKSVPRRLNSGREAMERLRYVSQKIADKIDEVLKTGYIRKAKELCESEYGQTMMTFAKLHSVGPAVAERWYASGYRDVHDIPESELTDVQKVKEGMMRGKEG
jgi:DNA polymerase/3'-5' exonuclease PolX